MTPTEIARIIMDEVPRRRCDTISTRVLALLVLVDSAVEMAMADIRDALDVSQATASEIVDEAQAALLVRRTTDWRDHRRTFVCITAKGAQVRKRRRGGAV